MPGPNTEKAAPASVAGVSVTRWPAVTVSDIPATGPSSVITIVDGFANEADITCGAPEPGGSMETVSALSYVLAGLAVSVTPVSVMV